MKQDFQNKMIEYLGGGKKVKKQTRMDKVLLKERLNFQNTGNPIIRIFGRMNQLIEGQMLQHGFSKLSSLPL